MVSDSGSDKEKTILKIKVSLKKSHPNWSEDKIVSTAFKIYNSRVKATNSKAKKEFEYKEEDEDFRVYGFIRTTYPDMEGDITPFQTLVNWADQINGGFPESNKGDYHHDRTDEHLVSVAEYAEVLPLGDGHYGLWVSDFVNTKHEKFDVIKYEIENQLLPAYSVEFDSRDIISTGGINIVSPTSKLYGYAHATRPVDLHALKTGIEKEYLGKNPKFEIIKYKEENTMAEDNNSTVTSPQETVVVKQKEVPVVNDTEHKPVVKAKEKVDTKPDPVLAFKEELENLTIKMKEILDKEIPEKKVMIKGKEAREEETMEELPLRFKEMKEAVGKRDWMAFKEAGMSYLEENDEALKMKFKEGIPLNTTMRMKCVGNKIEIVGAPELKFKDVLGTASNAGAYTESSVEFADIFQPGILQMFNNSPGLLGVMLKEDYSDSPFYSWTIETSRNTSGGAVHPDNITVETGFITKLKLHQEIKVYRYGVSVNDYTLHHSRKSLGDLYQLEVSKAMEALLHKLGGDLYREGVGTDSTDTSILGLEAVADSTGNATLYGKTRSSYATTLMGDALANTYLANAGDIVEAELRDGITNLETNGSMHENIMLVTTPTVRNYLLNLMDTGLRFNSTGATAAPAFGFNIYGVQPTFDGHPILIDFRCTSTLGNPIYCIDRSAWKLIVSKAPQLTGLAKVSAAESAYVEAYLTTVYTHPRRIYLYDSCTGPTS